ncbi:MAG: hypothetical protein R2736_16355 [Solirubrobacterales bacterium]
MAAATSFGQRAEQLEVDGLHPPGRVAEATDTLPRRPVRVTSGADAAQCTSCIWWSSMRRSSSA